VSPQLSLLYGDDLEDFSGLGLLAVETNLVASKLRVSGIEAETGMKGMCSRIERVARSTANAICDLGPIVNRRSCEWLSGLEPQKI